MVAGPAISILTPSYNGGDFIIEAVRGALEQMREDDELLVQDGGSTDGSMERLQELFGSYPQLKVVSGPDGGQADALNKALERAANPVMGWLNADDLLHPGALDAVRAAFEANAGVQVVYGSWTIVDREGHELRRKVPKSFHPLRLLLRPSVFSGAIFAKTQTVREIGGFDPDLYFVMDGDLWLRLAERRSAVQTPAFLAGFRWYTGSKTGGMDWALIREEVKLRNRYAHGVVGHGAAALAFLGDVLYLLLVPLRKARFIARLRTRRAGSAPA